jgi:hypothetical protein
VAESRRRASGSTGGETEAKALSEANMEPLTPSAPERRRFASPAFQRIRVVWEHEDAETVSRLKAAVERRMADEYADAYRVLNDVWDIVRRPKLDGDGDPVRDLHGMVVWEVDRYGRHLEDWTNLTMRKREDLMYSITTHLAVWEQQAADAWSEAMFARARWEEEFAVNFDEAPGLKETVDSRTQYAQRHAADARYFAVFLAAYSRKAEALVKSIERLSYRLERGLRS